MESVGVGAALFMKMGHGKSRVAIDLIQNHGFQKSIIVAPLSVIPAWVKQFKMFCTWDKREYNIVRLDSGSVLEKLEHIQDALEIGKLANSPVVILINYDSIRNEPLASWILEEDWDFVLLDESHRIKNASGKTSKFMEKLSSRAKYRLIMTGTPLAHSPQDIFAQYRFVEPTIFGNNFAEFKRRYILYGNASASLNKKIYSIAYRAPDDAIQLPPVVHIERTFTMNPALRKVYNQLERDFYADLRTVATKFGETEDENDLEVTIPNVLVKLLRLQQVVNGFVKNDVGDLIHIDSGKRDLLTDVLEDIDDSEPIVVFCKFHEDLEQIKLACEKSGRRYAELSGRVKQLEMWQNGHADILGVQTSAGGLGIDLTRAVNVIYYSVGYSLSEYEQSLARVNRPGQRGTVNYIHLIAEHSIDEIVRNALKDRKFVVQYIMDYHLRTE